MTNRPAPGSRVLLVLEGTVLSYLEPPKDEDLMVVDIDLSTHSFKTTSTLAFYVGDPKVLIKRMDSSSTS